MGDWAMVPHNIYEYASMGKWSVSYISVQHLFKLSFPLDMV